MSHFKKGNHPRAIAHFEIIIRKEKTYVRAYNNLGYVYQAMGEYDSALDVWERGLKVDESYGRLRKNIADARARLWEDADGAKPSPVGIEDFISQIDWVTPDAEVIDICESRFFETYLLKDSGKHHALKTPRRTLFVSKGALKAFELSCRDWLGLAPCRRVVSAGSLESVVRRPFLALEYAPEGSLRDLLNKGGAIGSSENSTSRDDRETLSLSRILEFAIEMCIGLHHIHCSTGRAHGDVRPENMLLYANEDGVGSGPDDLSTHLSLKITNVDLCMTFRQKSIFCNPDGGVLPEFADEGLILTPSGFMTSSLSWTAPELIETADTPTASTDVYAFGVVLYEMTTGLLPFSGSSPSEMLENIRGDVPEHPCVINTRIPKVLGNIAMRCLSARPEDRFADFHDIGKALVLHISQGRAALKELLGLCTRYTKVSRFQYRDDLADQDVMIVGGTEFASEIGQMWELLRQDAESGRDAKLGKRLTHIEEALSLPGFLISELHPTRDAIAAAVSAPPPDAYIDELELAGGHSRSHASHSDVADDRDENAQSSAPELDSPLDVVIEMDDYHNEDSGEEETISIADTFGAGAAERYSSFLIVGDTGRATALLANAVKLRAEILLLESEASEKSLKAFRELSGSENFIPRVESVLTEMSEVCGLPSPREYIEVDIKAQRESTATVTGLILMMGGRFSEAQEVFNKTSGSCYQQALNIYIWAMTEFGTRKMEGLLRSSLKSASTLLREGLADCEEPGNKMAAIMSSHPGGSPVDLYFLRGLVFERMGEHKYAVSNIRKARQALYKHKQLRPNVRPWASLFQGKCMHEMGMPSEAFIRWNRILTQEMRAPFYSFLELGASRPRKLMAEHVLPSVESSLSRFVDSALLWSIKSKLFAAAGDAAKAIECAERSISLKEEFTSGYFVKMEALILAGEHNEAFEALKICSSRDPKNPLYMLRSAEILCRRGDLMDGLSELRRSVDAGVNPAELEACMSVGRFSALEMFEEYEGIKAKLAKD